MALREYLTKAHYSAGHTTWPPGSVIRLNEQDAVLHVRQGTIEAVKDAETLRREALWVQLKDAAKREDAEGVFTALAELQPTPAPKPAPEPPPAPPAASTAPSGKPRG